MEILSTVVSKDKNKLSNTLKPTWAKCPRSAQNNVKFENLHFNDN